MNMKKLTLFFILLSSLMTFSQLSNKHWIPPLHCRVASNISEQYIYMSTNETTPFDVVATDGAGVKYPGSPFTISASAPKFFYVGTGQGGNNSKMFLNLSDVNIPISGKGVILEGPKDFYVSFRMKNSAHAETIISKGKPGIGTSFRLGCMINENTSNDNRKSFVASVMATEDNTKVTLSDYNRGVVFKSGAGNITLDSQQYFLNAGQSIIYTGYNNDPVVNNNIDGIIGGLITSDKPVAVNTGNALGGAIGSSADFTLDQIVSATQIGTDYIFIQGNGLSEMEYPLIVANENNTNVYVNGSTLPVLLNAGEYYKVASTNYQGTNANNKNIYVRATKPVYAYQLLGGGFSAATSGLNFIPPLSCFFQNSVNIPDVNTIGNTTYTSDLMILTYSNATININSVLIPTSQAQSVAGNTDWVTYRVQNRTGNLNVVSTGPLAVGVFGYDTGLSPAAGFAGYYSGFGSTPQDTNVSVCSNSTKDLFKEINGNPGTGGTWTVPSGGKPLNGNLFESNINIPGEYIYTFTKSCNTSSTTISVKVNVTIQQTKIAGKSGLTSSCVTSAPYDLFLLLGNTAEIGGTWSPALPSGTGLFNPAKDLSDVYSYSFPAIGSCAAVSASITVNNAVVPTLNPITDFEKCDDDTNGSVTFDLTTKTNEVLGTQPGINVTYHITQQDANLGQSAITTINSGNTVIWVRLTIIVSGCHIVNSFKLVVHPLPVVNDITIVQCDDDLDSITDFNLTINNPQISVNSVNENFTYFTSLAGANTGDPLELISTPQAFQNINPPLPAPQGLMYVWARVSNKITRCFSTAKLTLKVAASKIPPSYSYPLTPVCDDTLAKDGTLTGDPKINRRDGISTFDLTDAIKDVELQLPPPLSNYTIKYYRNKVAALAQNDSAGNSLAIKPSEYTNFRNDIPFAQNIWVRVNNNLTSDCGDGFGDFIKLTVEKLPFANPVNIPRQCDDNQDGIYAFDTMNLEIDLLNGQDPLDVTVTYFDETGATLPSPFPVPFSTKSQTIKAVVTNNTTLKCYDETPITFTVDKSPIDFTIPTSLTTTCDDEAEPSLQDGQFNFTSLQAIHTIVTSGQPSGMVYEYYDGILPLPTPLPNTFPVTLTKNITIVVYNPLNPSCKITKTIPFTVNPVPKIKLIDSELVCSNNPTFFVLLNAGLTDPTLIANYTYEWYFNNNTSPIPGETSYTLKNVNTEGIYTVKVINSFGCFRTRKITVIASDVANFLLPTISDLSDNNTVIINVTGFGNYVYSLDYPNAYQTPNIFTDVAPGVHTVYVKDLNGCGTSSQIINVIGIPKFFTPNADGYNDTWNVLGLTTTKSSNTTIYIFDRYGKLLKEISSISKGWDGTFNGEALPTDDYWYTIYFEDGRTEKGHFTLKR